MLQHVFKILAISLLLLTASSAANARVLYDNCIKPWDFGQNTTKQLVVRPVGSICYDRCETECKAFSRQIGGAEFNDDIISQCRVSCRNGNLFSSQYRLPTAAAGSNGLNFTWQPAATIGVACSRGSTAIDSVGYNVYDSGLLVNSGEKFTIELMTGQGVVKNQIFLCGNETVRIDPKYLGYTFTDFASNTELWSPANSSRWSARNNYYTDTGLDVKNGDLISIGYTGQYSAFCDITSFCSTDKKTLNLLVKVPSALSWQITTSTPSYVLPGESMTFNPTDTSIKFMGLTGYSTEIPTNAPLPASGVTNGQYWNGDMYINEMQPLIIFSGVLEGFSDNFTRLGIAHYDEGDSVNWLNNIGGYQVMITRKGCMYQNGDQLQYGISTPDPATDPNNPIYLEPTTWEDIGAATINANQPFTASKAGKVMLRIKPLPFDASTTPMCSLLSSICNNSVSHVQSLYSLANSDGQYYVVITKPNPTSQINIITDIVNYIRSFLFGDNNNQGTVQYIFNAFISDSGITQAILALMALYIALTGLSFMVGIAQITQKEAVTRLLKLGVVAALIGTTTSWEFFNTYLFRFFVDGGLELIALVGAGPDASNAKINELIADPSSFFSDFDKPLGMLFNYKTGYRIAAVAMTGVLGLLLAVIICYACVAYAICLARATLIYLISLIGIAVLLIVAPIFITFIMFQFTKQMFDAWLKQLASFMFQPVIVFAAISLLNYLMLTGMQVALGFSVCTKCLFRLYFAGLVDICLAPFGLTTMWGTHMPTSSILGIPIHFIAAVFYFLIIAKASLTFCNFGAKLTNTLITGAMYGPTLSETAAKTNFFSMWTAGFEKALGMDDKADAARQWRKASYESLKEQPKKIRNVGRNVKAMGKKIINKFTK